MDIFDYKNITPMLIGESRTPFDSDEYIYELKLDGVRCLAYLDSNSTQIRNKRNKNVSDIYPELSQIHKQVNNRCILDGEVYILKDGVPNFFEIQKRSIKTNAFKIKMASQKLPVCFTAYDIIYLDNEKVTDKPLLQRKQLLSETINESSFLNFSRYISGNGVAFFNLVKQQGLEGIVAKRKDSYYEIGKTTKEWIKMKALLDDDFVVCGYYISGNVASIILGQYSDNALIYIGHVVLGVSRQEFKLISSVKMTDKHNNFPDFDDVIWLFPSVVCVVEFMQRTVNGSLRQAVFKGLRDDKLPSECIFP